MSHAAMIIGIPGLQIERVKRSRGIEVWAEPLYKKLVICRPQVNAPVPVSARASEQAVGDHRAAAGERLLVGTAVRQALRGAGETDVDVRAGTGDRME